MSGLVGICSGIRVWRRKAGRRERSVAALMPLFGPAREDEKVFRDAERLIGLGRGRLDELAGAVEEMACESSGARSIVVSRYWQMFNCRAAYLIPGSKGHTRSRPAA